MDSHKKVKAVVFDLGNVLVDFNHLFAARRLQDLCDFTVQEIYNLFFDSELTCLFEEGKISPKSFFERVKQILNLKITYKEFLSIWNEIFFLTPKNKEVYQIAKKLKENYCVCLASNINILHFEYLKNNFNVFNIFDHIFLSYKLKTRKPADSFYRHILEKLSLKGEEVFYTDDRLELVESAKKLKIRGLVFLSVDKLKDDLISSGIII